ncbi:hypothetical protein OGATHE_002746 [Ogataea polymorpha]|uniref:Uncharacterized protein n=1 Tax=Ogataea polymorpha TaxID=460523 RepID=A0A9P8T8V3_9ASCO|nr:hypothetical protein OGATHE_002746 [Ogataea polymorpha]
MDLGSTPCRSEFIGNIPPSPWTGSIITPQVLSEIKLSTDLISLGFATLTPGMRGANGFWYLGFGVSESEPIDRPWKEFSKVINSILLSASDLPYFLANFIAASLASVPELAMNTRDAFFILPDSRVFETNCLLNSPVHWL